MLGRLARWLRLLGCDTLYYPDIEDSLLLRKAREEKRILLTRNTHLVKTRGVQNFLLLKENDPFKQLKAVIDTFKLISDSAELPGRCALCNAGLKEVSKKEVKNSVPLYVFQTSDVFKQCSGCGKLYWNGTHPGRFKKKLSEILS